MREQAVNPIPNGKNSVTPYVIVRGVDRMLDFARAAFDAEVYLRVSNADGTVGHAEMRIGNSVLMLFDAKPGWPETPSFLSLYVPDCDATFQRAIAAGAAVVTDLATSSIIGDRGGRVRDPLGNVWWIQTHLEDVSMEAMTERFRDPEELGRMLQSQASFEREMERRLRQQG